MSVLLNDRNLAYSEFEMQAIDILNESYRQMKNIPNRYVNLIRNPILDKESLLCKDVFIANEQNANTPNGKEKRDRYLNIGLGIIEEMEKPLWVYWNLFDKKDTAMDCLVQKFNRESALIRGLLKDMSKNKKIKILPRTQIEKAKFLKNISELQKFSYQKIVRCAKYENHLVESIADLIDNAFYCAIKGNEQIPFNKEMFEWREECFAKALDFLNAAQRPMYALWNLEEYSEAIMKEWATLLYNSIVGLSNVIKSDKKRFANFIE